MDNLEQRIHDTLTKIEVDSEGFKERILTLNKPKKIRRRFSFAAAIVAALVVMSAGALYAVGGGLDNFLSRFNPAFGDIAIPPEEPAYVINEGIRMEVVGAQQIDNAVLVYLTLQDITGEERLSRDIWPDFAIFIDGKAVSGSGDIRMLHFDRSNNTLYYEIRMMSYVDIPLADVLEVGAVSIDCFSETFPSTATVTEGDYESFTTRRLVDGEWRVFVNVSHGDNKVLTWTDTPAGVYFIERMTLSTLGLQILGTYHGDTAFSTRPVELELNNHRRNIRLYSGGGSFWADGFEVARWTDSPIDMDAVTAVIVDGVRLCINKAR